MRKRKPGAVLLPLVWFAIALAWASPVCGDTLEKVSITGLEDKLYKNVIAHLSIFRQKDEKDLDDWRIRRLHGKAEEEIREALEPFGYYNAVIEGELAKGETGWRASYAVVPGEPVRITSVAIAYPPLYLEVEEIGQVVFSFPLREGMVLDHEQYKEGKKELLQQLAALGYIDAEYESSKILVFRQKNSAAIEMRLKIGKRYRFGKTTFEQDLLDPKFLKGFLNYSQGEVYSRKKLVELQRILYQTNYFGRVVVRGEVNEAHGNFIPVRVIMSKPEFFTRYTFGAGFATDVGLRGKVGWDNRLFNRFGHSVSSEFTFAEREMGLDFLYNFPVNNPRFDKLTVGANYNKESWENTNTELFQGSLTYKHTDNWLTYGGGFMLHDERYDVGKTSGERFLAIPFVLASIIYADDPVNTENGVLLSLNLKGASEGVFSDATFAQALFSGKLITSPFEGVRLISRFSLGATAADELEDLPPSLRFYAGGDRSVRGFGFRELATKDEEGNIVGGRYLVFGSVELEKRLYKNWSGAVFVDTGKGVDDLSESLGKSVGAGVRYRLPFGQIRVDVASAVSEDGNPLRLHFNIGGDF